MINHHHHRFHIDINSDNLFFVFIPTNILMIPKSFFLYLKYYHNVCSENAINKNDNKVWMDKTHTLLQQYSSVDG